jgi:hypothetical protein
VVGAELPLPALVEFFGEAAAAVAISQVQQVRGGSEHELPAVGMVVTPLAGGQHMRGEAGVLGPVFGVAGIAGVGGYQQGYHLVRDGGPVVGGKSCGDTPGEVSADFG